MDEPIVVVDDDQEASLALLRSGHQPVTPKEENLSNNDSKNASGVRYVFGNEHRSLTSSPLTDLHAPLDGAGSPGMRTASGQLQTPPQQLPCVVCGSQANGFHFGTLSCAACNAFFRRSVAESRKYFCRKNGQCVIDQTARCFCRACRLKKCLEKGMDPNSVQPHRDVIGQKRKRQFDERRKDCYNSALTVAIDNVVEHCTPVPEKRFSALIPDDSSHDDRPLVLPFKESAPVKLPESLVASLALTANRKVNNREGKRNDSATAQLLTTTSAVAEQLLALSRAPLISSTGQEISSNDRRIENENSISRASLPQSEVSSVSGLSEEKSPVLELPQGSASVQDSAAHTSMQEPTPRSGSEQEVHFVTFDEFHHSLGHEEIVEHFDETPSSSGMWLYETESDSSSKNWRQADPSPKGLGGGRTRLAPSVGEYDPSTNMIERLVDAYRKLRERRRMLFCPGTIRDILSGTEPPLRVAQLGEHCGSARGVRIEVALVVEFVNHIHPFSKLRLDDRILLFKNASCPFTILEKHYTTMRGGGFQANRMINNDNSYHDLSVTENEKAYYAGNVETKRRDDVPNSFEPKNDETSSEVSKTRSDATNDVEVDPETIRRLLLPPLRESLRDISGPMYHFGMTDVEFVALVVVILFEPTLPGLSEMTRRLVKEARDRMYHDWFAYYAAHGITDAAQRVGNALLLLPAINVTWEQQCENYHLVRFFGIFEMDKLIDEFMS